MIAPRTGSSSTGATSNLTALELRLLCALFDGGTRVQSRESLLREVWGEERGVTTRTVDTHVKRLRKKLGLAARCIRSVRGVGYGFDVPGESRAEQLDFAYSSSGRAPIVA